MTTDSANSRAEPIRVCFVCLGNICRSPTAEGVFRHLVIEAGLDERFEIDSAGTGAWHVGEPPDRRSAGAAAQRGIQLTGRARAFHRDDFTTCDHVLAMDADNLRTLQQMAPTPDSAARVRLLREHDPKARAGAEVPDPYYGGPDGFDHVLDVVEAACRGLLADLRREHGL